MVNKRTKPRLTLGFNADIFDSMNLIFWDHSVLAFCKRFLCSSFSSTRFSRCILVAAIFSARSSWNVAPPDRWWSTPLVKNSSSTMPPVQMVVLWNKMNERYTNLQCLRLRHRNLRHILKCVHRKQPDLWDLGHRPCLIELCWDVSEKTLVNKGWE